MEKTRANDPQNKLCSQLVLGILSDSALFGITIVCLYLIGHLRTRFMFIRNTHLLAPG